MGRARVNISCINKFISYIQSEKDSVNTLKSNVNVTDEIIHNAHSEIEKIVECENNCKIALDNANRKINALKNELNEIKNVLITTPEVILVRESKIDEEGNIYYVDVRKPNPKYYELGNQNDKILTIESSLKRLIEELEAKIEKLSQTKYLYEDEINNIKRNRENILENCNNISNKSEIAYTQLEQAVRIIEKYLHETVRTENIPIYRAVYGNSYTTFDSIVSARPTINFSIRTSNDSTNNTEIFYGILGKNMTEINSNLLSKQGLANPDYRGTCGLVSIANVLRQLDVGNATEGEVLNRALELEACAMPKNGKTGGGTRNDDVLKIIRSYGLESSKVYDLSIDNIIDCLKKGGTMMMSVQSKYIRDNATIPSCVSFKKSTDHWVTITGLLVNKNTNEVSGIYVQDSGGHNSKSNIFISLSNFEKMRKISDDFTGIAIFK